MSKYTTEIRYLNEQNFPFALDKYPIFDEAYRSILNNKILDHYRFREIGLETPARFNHYLATKMNEIMPFYNTLYKLEIDKINPLHNTDYTETYDRKADGTTEATATGSMNTNRSSTGSSNRDNTDEILSVHSTTPSGLISVGNLKSNTWADEAQIADNKTSEKSSLTQKDLGTDTTDSTSNVITLNNEDYVKKVLGTTGGKSKSELISEYANSFLNLDMMIINELNELFMGVY